MAKNDKDLETLTPEQLKTVVGGFTPRGDDLSPLPVDTEPEFTFSGSNLEGYTYTTSHFRGEESFSWTD